MNLRGVTDYKKKLWDENHGNQDDLKERYGQALDVQQCPQCRKYFKVVWEGWPDPTTLVIRSCPSGGIYDVRFECPHCNYEEEL